MGVKYFKNVFNLWLIKKIKVVMIFKIILPDHTKTTHL